MEDRDMSSESISQQGKKVSDRLRTQLQDEAVEQQIKKIPNLVFFGLAISSMAASAILSARNKKISGNFVGLWVPTILTFGLYSKLAKMEDELVRNKMH